jgi:glycosyltransferase involved in cell wall biosynthesis
MKILFLSSWFPYPANNGSKIRIFNLLRGLAKVHDVTIITFIDHPSINPDTPALKELCNKCIAVPWREFNPKSWRARIGILSSKPRFLLDTYSPEMECAIRQQISENKFDLVIVSQLTMASYYDAYKDIPSIFEEVELGALHDKTFRTGNWHGRVRNWLTWFKLKTYLSRILKSFVLCTVVSEKELAIFTDTFPSYKTKAVVIPNCVNAKEYQTTGIERKQHHLIFTGTFHFAANYDGMLWFVEKVYPLVLEHVPDTKLLITGDHGGFPLPMTKNIERTGHVEDIKSLIASCNISIVPILSGGGTRLKILEAMALSTPVVSTSKGAEGLLVENGKHILIADDPERFASGLIRILQDNQFSQQLASNALQLVKEHYDWAQIMPGYLQMIEKVTVGPS